MAVRDDLETWEKLLRAVERDLTMSVHTGEPFATGKDIDNRAAVDAVATDELSVARFAVTGQRKPGDKLEFHL